MSDSQDFAAYILDNNCPVASLDAKEAFDGLSHGQASFAYHMCRASWEGAKICLLQASVESPILFTMFKSIYEAFEVQQINQVARESFGFSEGDIEAFHTYVSSFFNNMGNYLSFGDTKFVPNVDKTKFSCLCHYFIDRLSNIRGDIRDELKNQRWQDLVFDLENPRLRQLGMKPEGVSCYYSSDVTKEDASFVQEFMKDHKISPFNTRLFKSKDSSGDKTKYTLRVASAEGSLRNDDLVEEKPGADDFETKIDDIETSESNVCLPPQEGSHEFKGSIIDVACGDYAPMMARVITHLRRAREFAETENEVNFLTAYVKAFRTGSTPAHMAGSRYWVKNKGPIVENYIGFIETYRDPMGFRGEWEGFVAVVNKKLSEKFGQLVSEAEKLLPCLPWPSTLEKDEFLQPDFTSLDVLAFGSSMLPIGINIPNYDHIRQEPGGGFKNVTLGNVMSARNANERVTFLQDTDQSVYQNALPKSLEIQVGLHELLGHGSGKLLQENYDGTFNFPKEMTVLDGPVESWYKPGQTWDSVFSHLASSIEECRAEAVGIYLCPQPKVLPIFGYDANSQEAMDVVYVNWLNMARAGLLALLYYTPEKSLWGQAHMQGRYALLQVMLEAGEGFCQIKGFDHTGNTKSFDSQDVKNGKVDEGDSRVHITIDRTKIESVGVPAVGRFLEKLQAYKSTADYTRGKALFDHYTHVPEHWIPLRDLVVAKRKPRAMMVQPMLEKSAQGEITYRSFDASVEALPVSYVNLFTEGIDESLFDFWATEKDAHLVE